MHVRLLAWVWLVVGRLPWVLLVVWRPLTRLLMVRQLTRVLVLVLGRLLWVALLIIALMRIALLTVAAAAALHRSVPCAPRRVLWGANTDHGGGKHGIKRRSKYKQSIHTVPHAAAEYYYYNSSVH